MASLLLSFAGQSLGAAFGLVGAVARRVLGAFAGVVVDRTLFGGARNDLDKRLEEGSA
jgi:hypothetical protein